MRNNAVRKRIDDDTYEALEMAHLTEIYDQQVKIGDLEIAVATERRRKAIVYFAFTALLVAFSSLVLRDTMHTILASTSALVAVIGTIAMFPLTGVALYFTIQSIRIAQRWRETGSP